MFTYQRSQRPQITPTLANNGLSAAPDRLYSKLATKMQCHFVTLNFTGTLTIAGGAATALRNRGSIMAIAAEVGIDENGVDRHLYKGPVLRFISEMQSLSPLTAKRVTSTAAAAYPLQEMVRIYFADPFSQIPRETAYLVHDISQDFRVFVRLQQDDAAGDGATIGQQLAQVPGGVTATLTALKITVQQGFDATQAELPYFIPTTVQQMHQVPGTNALDPEYLRITSSIRALIVSQETTTVGEVGDIINSLALKGDNGDIIGPVQENWADLIAEQEAYFGGAVFGNSAHLAIKFQEHGALGNILNPDQFSNLRFEFNDTTSASAGVSQIRITRLQLERDPALCGPRNKDGSLGPIPFPV